MPNIEIKDWKSMLYLIGGAWLVYQVMKNDVKTGAVAAVSAIGTAVNPVSPDNLANRGLEAVYSGITDSNEPLGADFWSSTHNEDGTLKWFASPLWFVDKAIGVDSGYNWSFLK